MCVLSKKFAEWEKWYSEEGDSVCAQIREMLIDAAVFNVINESRKYVKTDSEGNPRLNDMVHGFINRNFFKTQALSIRKLCANDNVYSLRRLINDIKGNKVYLTRENILCAFDLPYDYENAINEGHYKNESKLIMKGAHSENVHKNIDLLTETNSTKRQPSDVIKDSVIERLTKRLDKCEPIVNYVNKVVAHTTNKRSLRISLAKIHMAHCRIIRTAEFIGQRLLYKSSGQTKLPAFAYDVFEHFEKPWATEETVEKLEEFWDKYERHIERWTAMSVSALV